MAFCVFIQIPETSKPKHYDVTYFRAFKKVFDVNVSEIELNLCMHFVKSFMYGYLILQID